MNPLAATGKSSCRRPEILIVVDQKAKDTLRALHVELPDECVERTSPLVFEAAASDSGMSAKVPSGPEVEAE